MMLFIYMKSIIIYVKVSAQVISMLTAIFIIIKYYQLLGPRFYKKKPIKVFLAKIDIFHLKSHAKPLL